MAFLTQPLPAELLHLLVEGEWALAAPPRADAGGNSVPVRHRFEAEGVDVWLTRDTGVAAEPLEAVARNLERREASVERSNVGGYHSHTDLFDAFPRATHAARQATETAARALGADVSARAPATRVAVEGARLVVDGGGDYQLAVRAGTAGLELAGAARATTSDAARRELAQRADLGDDFKEGEELVDEVDDVEGDGAVAHPERDLAAPRADHEQQDGEHDEGEHRGA